MVARQVEDAKAVVTSDIVHYGGLLSKQDEETGYGIVWAGDTHPNV